MAADMVNAFSPLALGSGMALVALGVVNAARHLGAPQALWTTPYGLALVAKLCVVVVVLGLGAWNAFGRRPRMGSASGALALRRTAVAELAAAAVVLAITAILVSLPSPR
jgi:putative copper export protein